MEKEYEAIAKKNFSEKKYLECLKACFRAMTLDPYLKWIYDLSGYCYLNLGMNSQGKGCFNVAMDLEDDKNVKSNYAKLIKLCDERDK